VRRPRGVQLDLNGVVKALAVDDAVALLSGPGFVSAGGDLATRGPVDVALPGGDAVRVVAGGVATSGSVGRRWLRGGMAQHHLIDPRTGAPSRSPWTEVTVVGATCLAADVCAKAAFLLGVDGPASLEWHGVPGRFLDGERVVVNESWAAALRQAAVCI
jgi:thiamine biosynthesis lipoprotein